MTLIALSHIDDWENLQKPNKKRLNKEIAGTKTYKINVEMFSIFKKRAAEYLHTKHTRQRCKRQLFLKHNPMILFV